MSEIKPREVGWAQRLLLELGRSADARLEVIKFLAQRFH